MVMATQKRSINSRAAYLWSPEVHIHRFVGAVVQKVSNATEMPVEFRERLVLDLRDFLTRGFCLRTAYRLGYLVLGNIERRTEVTEGIVDPLCEELAGVIAELAESTIAQHRVESIARKSRFPVKEALAELKDSDALSDLCLETSWNIYRDLQSLCITQEAT